MKALIRLVAAIVCLVSGSAWGQSYTVTDLGAFMPFHITEEGVIAGEAGGIGDFGALWHDGTLQTFPGITRLLDANGVHAVGQIVHAGQQNAATITFDGLITPLHTPDAADGSFANTISTLPGGIEAIWGYVRQGFQIFPARWLSNAPTAELLPSTPEGGAVNASNDLGQGAGFITVNGAEEVARWALDGSLTPLGTLGGNFAFANDMNNAGQMIGYGNQAGGPVTPFRSTGDSLTVLPIPPGFGFAQANAINASGQVVGTAFPKGPVCCVRDFKGYLWDVNGFPIDLNTLATAPEGWMLSFTYGINNAGQIVGIMGETAGSGAMRGFLLTPGLGVPPSLALSINQESFTPGQTLDTTLVLSNPGPQRQVDMYVGIVFPNGWVWWVQDMNTFAGTASDSLEADPRGFTPLLANMTLIAGLNATWTDFIEHTWTGVEGFGTYHLVVGWTAAGSLQDGVIHDKDKETGKDIWSYTIITTVPNEIVGQYHDRMPVILEKDLEEAWLDPDLVDVERISQMLKPYPSEKMEEWRVSDEARNQKNDYPEVMKPMVSSEGV